MIAGVVTINKIDSNDSIGSNNVLDTVVVGRISLWPVLDTVVVGRISLWAVLDTVVVGRISQ